MSPPGAQSGTAHQPELSASLAETVAGYRERVEHALRAALDGPETPPHSLVRYQLGWVDEQGQPVTAERGKAVRPLLCLLMCEALGGCIEQALPAAAAVELIHNFALIHDDVMDGTATRRHRPSVWATWGTAQAINAGDLMLALAVRSVLRSAELVGTDRAHGSLQALLEACVRMAQGQHLDLTFEQRLDPSVGFYLNMVEGKTGALIGAACELGAIAAGAAPAVQAECRDYGHKLGAGFQIQDDILGIWGDPHTTGKPVSADIRGRKKTFPVIHALEAEPTEDQRRLQALYASGAPDVDEVRTILERAGSHDIAQREAGRLFDEAAVILDRLPLTPEGRQRLIDLAGWLGSRLA